MENKFLVSLRGNSIEEFKQDVREYGLLKFGVELKFEDRSNIGLKYIDIEHTILQYFDITLSDLRKEKVEGDASMAKSFLIYILCEEGYVLERIAELLNPNDPDDHSSVIYHRNKAKRGIEKQVAWRITYNDLIKTFNRIKNGVQNGIETSGHKEG